MARVADNPVNNNPGANDPILSENLSTGDDQSLTPLIITQFAQQNMGLATGSSNGLVSGPNGDKLAGLDTQAETDTRVTQLSQTAMPVFIGTPADGYIIIYQHATATEWLLSAAFACVSAGSTNLTVSKNGVAIPGFTSIPITSSFTIPTPTGPSSGYTLSLSDTLGLTFAGTTGNCVNLRFSMGIQQQISP